MLVKRPRAINFHIQSRTTFLPPVATYFSDVWGPAPDSIGRKKYYVSFIDDYSKYTWIYLVKYKSEVFQKFHEFQQLVERQFDKKIIAVQKDWGGEYEKLSSFFYQDCYFSSCFLSSCTSAKRFDRAQTLSYS
jgi:hypothetical protein